MRHKLSECQHQSGVLKGRISHAMEQRREEDSLLGKHKDTDKRFTDALIEMKTMEMANADLDVYYQALDRALISCAPRRPAPPVGL